MVKRCVASRKRTALKWAIWSVFPLIAGLCFRPEFRSWRENHQPVSVYVQRLPSGQLFISEDPQNARLQAFRQQEQLDRLVQNEPTELGKLVALSRWALDLFPNGSPFPEYPPWDAAAILERMRHQNARGFCAQYALVYGQALQSLGFPVRYVDLASRNLKRTHFVPEVYLPSARKWVVVRILHAGYFEDAAGRPLSALEVHDHYVGNATGPVYRMPGHEPARQEDMMLFYHFRYYLRNNYLSVPVFVTYHSQWSGTQMVFENYRLRWLDEFTRALPRESAPSLVSSDRSDFDYPVDFSKAVALGDGRSLLRAERGAPQLYRLQVTRQALIQYVKSKLAASLGYRPLTTGVVLPG